MTPKQKAKELVERFMKWSKYENHVRNKRVAKQCALICVDEDLKLAKYIGDKYNDWSKWNELQEVKQEIDKL